MLALSPGKKAHPTTEAPRIKTNQGYLNPRIILPKNSKPILVPCDYFPRKKIQELKIYEHIKNEFDAFKKNRRSKKKENLPVYIIRFDFPDVPRGQFIGFPPIEGWTAVLDAALKKLDEEGFKPISLVNLIRFVLLHGTKGKNLSTLSLLSPNSALVAGKFGGYLLKDNGFLFAKGSNRVYFLVSR